MIFHTRKNNPENFTPEGGWITMEYILKFRDGGVWMETNSFVELVSELNTRFGLDANVRPEAGGLKFELREKHDQ
jgi:hypothetical protein